jgi:hypothetical protein
VSKRPVLKMPAPFQTPPGAEGDPCHLVFGHNVEIRKVLMKFSVTASQLVFSPEEAEDVASKLLYYAKAARGEKVS